jgi:D-glycero-alpha-D-manno-heptose-7-phosphate kinase
VADAIVTRAPTRIDFGGGWTDVPPYSDEVGGFVCNVAITRYATVTVTRGLERDAATQPLTGVDLAIVQAAAKRFRMPDARIAVESDFPIGAGLGGSSAVAVATLAALSAVRGETMRPDKLAELAGSLRRGAWWCIGPSLVPRAS